MKRYVSFSFVIMQEVMANINVLCARVLNRIFGNFYGTFIVTKDVGSYLVSHQSPKGFASYIEFGHNMHRPLYIPLPRWTKPRNFASYLTKKPENAQASGNPRRYSCDPWLPAKSESEYPKRSKLAPLGYHKPMLGVCLRYRRIYSQPKGVIPLG